MISWPYAVLIGFCGFLLGAFIMALAYMADDRDDPRERLWEEDRP